MQKPMVRLKSQMASCAATPVAAMSDDEAVAWLDDLIALTAPLMASQAQAVHELDRRGLPRAHGTRSIVTWLANRHRLGRRQARRLVELGGLLSRRPALNRAMAAGTVNVEQAEAIGAATTRLAEEPDVGPDLVDQAETMLVERAAVTAPRALQVLGGQVLAQIAPELAGRVEALSQVRKEARGRAARRFHLTRIPDGRVRCSGWLDKEGAATVQAAIESLSATPPPHSHPTWSRRDPRGRSLLGVNDFIPADDSTDVPDLVVGDDRTPGQRRADALVEACRLALHSTKHPVSDEDRCQLEVTVPQDVTGKATAIDRPFTGRLDAVERLTCTQVPSPSYDSLIIPAALDTAGQILDYSSAPRLCGGSLDRAPLLGSGGCAIPGCDKSAAGIDAHLLYRWSGGSRARLDSHALLCGHHQRVIHRMDWTTLMAAGGRP